MAERIFRTLFRGFSDSLPLDDSLRLQMVIHDVPGVPIKRDVVVDDKLVAEAPLAQGVAILFVAPNANPAQAAVSR